VAGADAPPTRKATDAADEIWRPALRSGGERRSACGDSSTGRKVLLIKTSPAALPLPPTPPPLAPIKPALLPSDGDIGNGDAIAPPDADVPPPKLADDDDDDDGGSALPLAVVMPPAPAAAAAPTLAADAESEGCTAAFDDCSEPEAGIDEPEKVEDEENEEEVEEDDVGGPDAVAPAAAAGRVAEPLSEPRLLALGKCVRRGESNGGVCISTDGGARGGPDAHRRKQ
jgi:hypothetical protein